MMELAIVEESISDVTRRLWEGMLHCVLQSVDSIPSALAATHSRSATVRISGAWNGAVLVQMSPTLARLVGEIMFDRAAHLYSELNEPQVPLEDDLIDDCLREVTNITAGNLKCALPEPCLLDIPVTGGHDTWEQTLRGKRVLCQLSLRCMHPMSQGSSALGAQGRDDADCYFRVSLIKDLT
jgi:hypothetical protein